MLGGMNRSTTSALDRRTFLKLAAGSAALAATGGAAFGRAMQQEKMLRVACVGTGGMGSADLREVSAHPRVKIVGLCDVDAGRLAEPKGQFPDAKTFADWRKMYEELGDGFDAVVVSTPDHTHAPATMAAMNRDKHVYCQKPLTHDIYEARQLAKMAAQKPNVVTQMGTQFHARIPKRQATMLLQDAAAREEIVGRVTAIYGWSDRPAGWWPQGVERPEGEDPVPADLDWNLWLGTAQERPFKEGMYAPFNWRGALDFGCGALGDMACHILDVPYYGLDLGYATSVVCHAQDGTDDRFPSREQIVLMFPGGDYSGGRPVPLYWSDGGMIPHHKATGVPRDFDATDNATVIVGTKGSLHMPHPGGDPHWFAPGEEGPVERDLTRMKADLPERNHYHHWVDVALGNGEETACRFQKSGPMTEALCVGAVAARFPHQTLQWDAEAMEFDHPEATKLVRRKYREGFEVENL